jgi:hypothetical protein
MRRLILLALPIAALVGLVASSAGHVATAASRTHVPQVTGTFTDKPYTATTPDSGTVANWAIDLFTRSFVVSPTNQNGTTTVVEHFNNGRFITLGDGATGSAASPGQGDSGGNATHMLREGVSGSFTGTFTIIVNAGFTYNPGNGCGQAVSSASTDDGCTTALWISHNFSGAVYGTDTNTTAYNLVYKAVGHALLGTTWTDASSGDSGDIYTSG